MLSISITVAKIKNIMSYFRIRFIFRVNKIIVILLTVSNRSSCSQYIFVWASRLFNKIPMNRSVLLFYAIQNFQPEYIFFFFFSSQIWLFDQKRNISFNVVPEAIKVYFKEIVSLEFLLRFVVSFPRNKQDTFTFLSMYNTKFL